MTNNPNLNYPIKYAAMPIINNKAEYKIVAYLPVKCYLIKEIKTYDSNGSSNMNYEVVFAFAKLNYLHFANSIKQFPNFNLNKACYNSLIVDNIYENFDDTLKASNYNNEILKQNNVLLIGTSPEDIIKYQNDLNKANDLIDNYMLLIPQIEESTNNLKITCTNKERLMPRDEFSVDEYLIHSLRIKKGNK